MKNIIVLISILLSSIIILSKTNESIFSNVEAFEMKKNKEKYLINSNIISILKLKNSSKSPFFTEYSDIKIKNIPETILIKGGTFTMGNNDSIKDEKPSHLVTISDYYISKYEITNKQFAEFVNDYGSDKTKNSSDYPNQIIIYEFSARGLLKNDTKWISATGCEDFPIVNVTWFGAYEYCKWLNEKTGKNYSLPSEAQWEYAAGGGTIHQKWAGTNTETNLGNFAWYSDNKSYKVGTKNANSLGIYDMSGNVCEWCLDWYNETYYTANAVTNPVNLTVGSYRILRGGGYYNKAGNCRSTNRNFDYANSNSINYGFRIVCL